MTRYPAAYTSLQITPAEYEILTICDELDTDDIDAIRRAGFPDLTSAILELRKERLTQISKESK